MTSNDTFDDGDATRVVGRRPPAGLFAGGAPQALEASTAELHALTGLNPIVASASALLAALPRIRASVSHPDPAGLRESLLEQVREFENSARSRGVPAESIMVARYALATMIDETVAGTPWGGTADWVQKSLLVTLHKETWGGEKFYQLLNKLAEDPVRNIDLLELLFVCLSLGFEGRFRVVDNGRAQLEALREKLAGMIRSARGQYERDLSTQWRGEKSAIGKSHGFLALWASGAVAAALLLAVYLSLTFSLNRASDQLAFGRVQVAHTVRAAQAPPPNQPRLAALLAPEIEKGLVEVTDSAGESRVLMHGSDLFASGSASVEPGIASLLARVAAALDRVEGSVTITGHTDDQPIRSARFPSNWQLSEARAQAVLRQLAPLLRNPGRVTAEGRGDQEPLVPNDSAQNRARNRRVEILLRVAATNPMGSGS